MSSKQQRKRLKPTDGTQPTFYVGDRFCTNTSTEKPYSFKHKMVVGPWKDRRALIECLFGYHNFCTYSSSRQDIVFDGKAQSRAFRAYIKGYYWKDFVDAGGDVDKCTPLADDTIIGVNQWIVVSSHLLPPWAPCYLPSKRYAFIKDKVPERAGASTALNGGDGDAHGDSHGDGDGPHRMDYPRNRWEHQYWPKGMPHRVKWQRKHFSNFSEDDKALCKKFYSALPESKLHPGQPFTRDFKALFKKTKDREEKVVPVGIPKTMMAAMMDNDVCQDHENETRAAYEAACRPPPHRYPLSVRTMLIKSHGCADTDVDAMETTVSRAIDDIRAKAEEDAKPEDNRDPFASLFVSDSEDEKPSKTNTKPTKRKSVQEPPLVDDKPKPQKKAKTPAHVQPLRRSSRLRNRHT